jgi:hypothetical protein
MPQRQGPTRRIEQLRRQLEAEGVLATPEPDDTLAAPAWQASRKPKAGEGYHPPRQ